MKSRNTNLVLALCLVLLAAFGLGYRARAAETDARLVLGRGKLEVTAGTATITTTAADFTSWQRLVTITPEATHALAKLRVTIDLSKATTGLASTYTSGTVQFAVARRVDGTNFRTASNTATAALSGTNASGLSAELDVGDARARASRSWSR